MGAIITRIIDLRCSCGKTDSVKLVYRDSNDAYHRALATAQAEQRMNHGCSSQ